MASSALPPGFTWDNEAAPAAPPNALPHGFAWDTPQAPQQPTMLQDALNNPVAHVLKSAFVDAPLTALGGLGAATSWVERLGGIGGKYTRPVYDAGKSITDFANRAQNYADTPFNNASAAARNTPGYPAARAVADQYVNNENVGGPGQFLPPAVPVAAAMASHFMKNPKGSTTSDLSNAMADASSSALSTYAAEHPHASAIANIFPALVAGVGAVSPKVADFMGASSPKPTIAAIRSAASDTAGAASDAYKVADNSGALISSDAVSRLQRTLEQKLGDFGVDHTATPQTMGAFKYIADQAATGNPVTVKGLERMRARATNAIANANGPSGLAADRKAAAIIRNTLDDFMDPESPTGMKPTDVVGPGGVGVVPNDALHALQDARGMWKAKSQAEELADAMDRANYSAQDYARALRTKFGAIAGNQDRMRFYSPDTRAAIQAVAEGTAPENALRYLGNKVKGIGGMIVGAMAGRDSALGEAGGAMAANLIGNVTTALPDMMTASRAAKAAKIALAGGKATNVPTVPWAQFGSIGLPALSATALNLGYNNSGQ